MSNLKDMHLTPVVSKLRTSKPHSFSHVVWKPMAKVAEVPFWTRNGKIWKALRINNDSFQSNELILLQMSLVSILHQDGVSESLSGNTAKRTRLRKPCALVSQLKFGANMEKKQYRKRFRYEAPSVLQYRADRSASGGTNVSGKVFRRGAT